MNNQLEYLLQFPSLESCAFFILYKMKNFKGCFFKIRALKIILAKRALVWPNGLNNLILFLAIKVIIMSHATMALIFMSKLLVYIKF